LRKQTPIYLRKTPNWESDQAKWESK